MSRNRALLTPRSVAVVGASDNVNRVGGRPIHYLRRFGFEGPIYPINPNRETVQGLKAYPDVASLPETPDLVVVVVPSDGVESIIDSCISRNVPNAVIISSGFGETGSEGREVERRMVARAHEGGLRLLGPNAQGVANFKTGAIANFSTIFMELPPEDGPIAVVSQSGALSQMLYAFLRQSGYGLRYMTASGNDADLWAADIIQMILDDEDVRIILVYLESIKNGPALATALERARKNDVSVVALKTGSSERGRQSAMSHTGAMATEDGVTRAFLRTHGAWQVEGVREMVEAVPLYLKACGPGAGRIGVLSHSGAVGVICADTAERLNLDMASLAPETQERLATILPSYGAIQNPVDMTAGLIGGGTMFGDTLRAVANDPGVDVVHIGMPVAGPGYDVTGFAAAAAATEQETGKPVTVSAPQSSIRDVFKDAGVVIYDDDVTALTALRQYVGHRDLQARQSTDAADIHVSFDRQSGAILDEAASLDVLAAAKLPIVDYTVCYSCDEATAAHSHYDRAVVVKGCSEQIPHKSEHGLVHLGLSTTDDVHAAAADCIDRMESMNIAGKVIVAPMHRGRHEMVIGAKRDPSIGPVIMLGDGGKYVEALKDSALLIPPFSVGDALEAIGKLHVSPIFKGVRGEPPMDTEAAAKAAVQLGALMLSNTEIESIDMNPVILGDQGAGVLILDALITLSERSAS